MPEPFRAFASKVVALPRGERRHGPDRPRPLPQGHRQGGPRATRCSATGGSRRTAASRTRRSCWTGPRWPGAGSCWPATTSAPAAPASTRRGRSARGASGRSCRPRSPTSSAATRSRTACCRSWWTRDPPAAARPRRRGPDAQLRVDLAEQGILLPDGSTIDFEVDPFSKMMLLAGTDEIGYVQAQGRRDRRLGGRATRRASTPASGPPPAERRASAQPVPARSPARSGVLPILGAWITPSTRSRSSSSCSP